MNGLSPTITKASFGFPLSGRVEETSNGAYLNPLLDGKTDVSEGIGEMEGGVCVDVE